MFFAGKMDSRDLRHLRDDIINMRNYQVIRKWPIRCILWWSLTFIPRRSRPDSKGGGSRRQVTATDLIEEGGTQAVVFGVALKNSDNDTEASKVEEHFCFPVAHISDLGEHGIFMPDDDTSFEKLCSEKSKEKCYRPMGPLVLDRRPQRNSNFTLLETLIRQEGADQTKLLLHESFVGAFFPWDKFHMGSISFTHLEVQQHLHPLLPTAKTTNIYKPIEEKVISSGMTLVCEDFKVSDWSKEARRKTVRERCISHMMKIRLFLQNVMDNCQDVHLQLWDQSGELFGTGTPKRKGSHYSTVVESVALEKFFTHDSGQVRNSTFVFCLLMFNPCTKVLFLAENAGDRAVFLVSGERYHAAPL